VTPTLRPMSLGEILDRTFHIYRSRFLIFLAIGLAEPITTLATLLLGKIGSQTTLSTPTKEMLRQMAVWMPRDWPASFVHFLCWPLIAYLTSGILLGEKPTLISAISWCKDRWQSWIAISGIQWAVCRLLPRVVERMMWASRSEVWVGRHSGIGLPPALGSLFFSLLQWGANDFLVLAVALSAPAWTVEQLGAVPSLLRGWKLLKGTWARVFCAQLLRDLLAWVLMVSLIVIAGIVVSLLAGTHGDQPFLGRMRMNVILYVGQAVSAVLAAILPIALTLFYYDQRIRHEGYDIERMMDAAGLNATATLPAADEPLTPATAEEGLA
jgi:hypothetical protein